MGTLSTLNHAPYLYSLVLLLSLWGSDEAAAAPTGCTFTCEDSLGLCRLNESGSFERVFDRGGLARIADYQDLAGGGLAVLHRGHQDPGWVFILDATGKLIVTRELAQARSLQEVLGAFPDGTLLCNAASTTALCDLWVPVSPGDFLMPRSAPERCTFPRLIGGKNLACVDEYEGVSVRVADAEGRLPRIHVDLPSGALLDFFPFAPDRFAFLVSGRLYMWHRGDLTQVTDLHVPWLRELSGQLYFAECKETESAWPPECRLVKLAPDGRRAVVWSGRGEVPISVCSEPGGAIMLDVDSPGQRRILRLLPNTEPGPVWTGRCLSCQTVPD